MTEHKKYRRFERIIYRVLIVICALAVIMAILVMYFYGETEIL